MKKMIWLIFVTVMFLAPGQALVAQAPPPDLERDPDFIAGLAALNDGFYQVAAKRFELFVDKTVAKRRKAYGSVFMFRAWYGAGEYERIIEWLRENWNVSKGTRDEASYSFWYAQAKYALGLHDDTLEYLKRFESKFPDDNLLPFVIRLRALALRDSGKLEAAEALFARFDKDFGDSVEVADNLMDWAGVLFQLNKSELGREKLELLVQRFPERAVAKRAQLWLGQWAKENDKSDEASGWLKPLTADTEADPSIRAEAWFALADLMAGQGLATNALHALAQAERLTTNVNRRVEARIDQARLLMGLNRLFEAVQIMDETVVSLALQPQAARAQIELSDLLRAQGQYEKALNAYQRYLESFSDDEGRRQALLGRAWCLWELKRYAEAALAFEKAHAVLVEPVRREEALVKMADAYFMNGQYRMAAATYERAAVELTNSPSQPEYLFQAADSYARISDATSTVTVIDRLVESHPESEAAKRGLLRLASFQEEQREWPAAASTYERIMTSYPKDSILAEALLGRALLRYRNRDYREALNDFEKVLETFPDTAMAEKAYFMKAWSFDQLNEFTEAQAIARSFLAIYTNSPWRAEVAFWLAEHDFNLQQYGVAETNFSAVASEYPASSLADHALFWAGRATVEQKGYRRAIEYFNQLIRVHTNSPLIPDARFAQGDALTEIGDFAGAILAFDEIIRKYPDHTLVPRALGRIGDCQFSLGSERAERYQEAAVTFRSVLSHPLTQPDVAIQSEYKLARTYERLGRPEEAFTHYMNVMYGWLAERDRPVPLDEVWLVRSAFSAAAIKEAQREWDDAIKIYQRIVESGITAAVDAEIRIDRINGQRRNATGGASTDAKLVP